MSVSERIISAKKNGKRRIVGLLVFLPEDILDELDDLAAFYGSLDIAVLEAIKSLYHKIYGSDLEPTLQPPVNVDSIIEKLEAKISQLLSAIPTNSFRSTEKSTKIMNLDLPDLEEVSEEPQEEELDLDDVIEDIMVVAVDDEFESGENNESTDSRRKRKNSKDNAQ